jgi:hypothetical protein
MNIPTKATALDILKAIDDWAIRHQTSPQYCGDTQTTDLWLILTALRGSDVRSEDLEYKMATTARIRARSLPKLAQLNGAFVNTDGCPVETSNIYDHFNTHITAAYFALLSQFSAQKTSRRSTR